MADVDHGATPAPKKRPQVALFPLDKQSHEVLSDCFANFSIEAIAATDTSILGTQKLEGCVVSLTNPAAEQIVASARSSAWQKHIVIYAVGPSANVRSLTKYGINVLLDCPVTRSTALKAIHSTRLLLLNELRRYVRLPLATPVVVQYESQEFTATSVEISAGGMSVECNDHHFVPRDTSISASFAVPGSSPVEITGTICWADHEGGHFGIRYDPAAPGRQAIRAWIETYLGFD